MAIIRSNWWLNQVSLLSLSTALCWATCAAGADRTAAELLPATTVVYVEMSQPGKLLATLLEHPLRRRIEALDQVRSALEKKEYLDAKAGIAIVESQLGMPWHKVVGQAAGGGLVLAVDAPTRGVVMLARATDDTTQTKLVETLVALAKQDAANKGNPDPVKTVDYRGIKAYALDETKFAVFDRWLVATNQDELGKKILDRWVDARPKSLATDESFERASAASRDGTMWGYVNTAMLRDAGVAPELFSGRANNPASEILLGGVLSTLHRTPYATASLSVEANRLNLVLSSPLDRSWSGELREHFFGLQGQGSAPPLLLADEALLAMGAFRDISRMWVRAGDLFDDKINEELAKADSNLTTLFGGKDFGEDILGALRPEIQIVVNRQVFGPGQPAPAIKLPAFALAATLKDPVKMQPELRRIFQSLIGFLNIVGAMNGQPPLDQEMERLDGGQIIVAKYLPDANAKDQLALKINYNFSPTVAFAGERFVVSSNEALARQLVSAKQLVTATLPDPVGDAARRVTNTDAVFRFDLLRDVLADNQAQLVAQNMLEKGHTKPEAEHEVGLLLELIGWLQRTALRLDTSPHDLRLAIEVAIGRPTDE